MGLSLSAGPAPLLMGHWCAPLMRCAGSNGAADGGEGVVQEAPAAQPPHSSADWGQIAEGIKGAISSDIKTLHFEMIRQFHIQQASDLACAGKQSPSGTTLRSAAEVVACRPR